MFRFATVLARVDVCRARVGRAGRAISSLVLVFTFALSLSSLERVNLHPVIIFKKKAVKVEKDVENVKKSCAVGICTQLQTVSKKSGPYSSSLFFLNKS